METIDHLPLPIQYVIRRFADPALTYEKLGQERGISKQAVQKQAAAAMQYLETYTPRSATPKEIPDESAEPACQNCSRLEQLNSHLKRQLTLASATEQLLRFFRQKVLKLFPHFKADRLPALEKKHLLDKLEKFQKEGGLIKDFAKAIQRSAETLARWRELYEKHGMAGLEDKTTRPKGFGNKLPAFIKEQLVLLFLQFPQWTPYQYHSYIRHNPVTHWYVSIPVIQKLKQAHQQRSAEEKERITKRWCFAPGTRVWSIDFTCILKTESFKLQCLTISDQRSRFLIHTSLHLNTSTERIVKELEELFIKYGRPDIIKADNGPEFRTEFRDQLRGLSIYLLNSPEYYGQFNGSHERIHRTMKTYISSFEEHQNITRLVKEIEKFQDDYNFKIPMDFLNGKTPADIFFGDESYQPTGAEVVTPYEKDGELRMKFTGRDGQPARMSMPLIPAEK